MDEVARPGDDEPARAALVGAHVARGPDRPDDAALVAQANTAYSAYVKDQTEQLVAKTEFFPPADVSWSTDADGGQALAEFAKAVGAGENKRVLLVVDKAGWHTGGEVEVHELSDDELKDAAASLR